MQIGQLEASLLGEVVVGTMKWPRVYRTANPELLDCVAPYFAKEIMERKMTFIHALEVSNASLLYLLMQTSAA